MKKALRRALFCSPKPLRHGRASTVQCCRILLRKSLVRGWRASGLLKKSSLEQSSRILPPTSMKITRLLTLRAKPISWVERGGGLVEQHHDGVHRQRARNGHTLLLAARELARELVLVRHQANTFEHLQAALLGVVRAAAQHLELRNGQGRSAD